MIGDFPLRTTEERQLAIVHLEQQKKDEWRISIKNNRRETIGDFPLRTTEERQLAIFYVEQQKKDDWRFFT